MILAFVLCVFYLTIHTWCMGIVSIVHEIGRIIFSVLHKIVQRTWKQYKIKTVIYVDIYKQTNPTKEKEQSGAREEKKIKRKWEEQSTVSRVLFSVETQSIKKIVCFYLD